MLIWIAKRREQFPWAEKIIIVRILEGRILYDNYLGGGDVRID
jgi:hypothetical protein